MESRWVDQTFAARFVHRRPTETTELRLGEVLTVLTQTDEFVEFCRAGETSSSDLLISSRQVFDAATSGFDEGTAVRRWPSGRRLVTLAVWLALFVLVVTVSIFGLSLLR